MDELGLTVYNRAHPRVSGENHSSVFLVVLAMGSSPRERGKQRHYPGGVSARGLIPA